MHPELVRFQEQICQVNPEGCRDLVLDKESSDYGAASFMLNQSRILFRVAKITPTKTGQFVTLWKRNNGGPIQPFEVSDLIDFVIISVRSETNIGQFIFSKKLLAEKNIFSVNNKGGKRAMRVYAPWDKANSKQALKTKEWQAHFFVSNENMQEIKEILE